MHEVIGPKLKRAKIEAEAARAKARSAEAYAKKVGIDLRTFEWKPASKIGKIIEGREERKYRAHRCWYCERRHHSKDPVCPPARKDIGAWSSISRRVGGKRNDFRGKFSGTKIRFD